jgi:Protein kinase domain
MGVATCPTCSVELPPGGHFCAACGAPLSPAVADPTGPYQSEGAPPESRPFSSSGRSTPHPGSQMPGFLPGQVLVGRYRIVAALGKGGMGEVYRADDLTLGQAVALKFLPPQLAQDNARLARFRNEVRVARQVSHPNVCRVYDIGEADSQLFLTMEYIDGEDLAALLKKVGRLPEDKGIELTRQLCLGLSAAHERGVIHRDLKPHNIMLDGRGHVRLTDFGLAGFAGEFQAGDLRSGTPAYMAPEQLAGREGSVQSDLFSLGLILYELFTGKRAFQARDVNELMRLQADGPPSKPSSQVTRLDPALDRLILRCLERDPKDRPKSALQVLAELPGGDPLQAALAAGETPAPEVVANAGGEGTLSLAVALACLAGTLVGLVVLVLLAPRERLLGRVPLDKPPAELAIRAGDLVNRLGYDELPRDTAYGFAVDKEYLRYVRETEASPTRWDGLKTGQPAAVHFWYRQSPQYLFAGELLDRTTGNRWQAVTPADPPEVVPGMLSLRFDTKGRLLALRALPAARDADASAPGGAGLAEGDFDWSPLFQAAGLKPPGPAQRVDSTWVPPSAYDRRAAWLVSYPDRPDLPLRIEAAAYRGKPVSFQLLGPWAEGNHLASTSPFGSTFDALLSSFFVLILLGATLLAFRNLRLRRGDRRGAFRLAAYAFAVCLLAWLLRASHLPVHSEYPLFLLGLAYAL